MGKSIRSIMKMVLKDAGVRRDMVDLILNQANWSLLRPPAEQLLETVGREFARRLKESGWSSEEGYETPLMLWRRLFRTVKARVPPGAPKAVDPGSDPSTEEDPAAQGGQEPVPGPAPRDQVPQAGAREAVSFCPKLQRNLEKNKLVGCLALFQHSGD